MMKLGLLLLLTFAIFANESVYSRLIRYNYPVKEDKPIVLLIRSYNNIKYYEKNLQSALNQNYSNYRAIYIEDRSPDGTYDAVKKYLAEHDKQGIVTLIQNKKRLGAMANAYFGAHMCKNDEIIVILDGDDWFPNDKVLKKINHMYANPDVWFTYGQYLNITPFKSKRGHCRLFYSKCTNVRNHPFITSHLRTFYAGLFKRIRLQDLLYQGRYLHVCEDNAGSFPMLEMARGHIYFNPEILYVHNCLNPLNDFRRYKKFQPQITKYLRNLQKYTPLACHPKTEELVGEIDFIIQPTCLKQLLLIIGNIKTRCSGFRHIYIQTTQQDKYQSIRKYHPEVRWINSNDTAAAITRSDAKYLCLTDDTHIFQGSYAFDQCARLLTMTQAFAMHLGLGQASRETIQSLYINDEVSAWVYGDNKAFWETQPAASMTVYSKKMLKNLLESREVPGHFKKNLMIGLYPNDPAIVAKSP